MDPYDRIIKKLSSDGVVYVKSDYEQIAVKVELNKPMATMKPKGEKEYHAAQTTKIVTDILLEADEITEQQYKEY